jgi:hypothetical protein
MRLFIGREGPQRPSSVLLEGIVPLFPAWSVFQYLVSLQLVIDLMCVG